MTDARTEAALNAAWSHTIQHQGGMSFAQWQEKNHDTAGEFSKSIAAAVEAADAAAWNTDIKKAPGFRQTIVVHLKNGDTTLANNEFPQGEDGWVDMMGDNIAEADIEAWMLIPRFTPPTKEANP